MRVLIIEDDDLLRGQMVRCFRREGFSVDQAEDGAKGLAAFRRCRADVVVTDLLMPNKEGLETIQEFKRVWPEIPVVAVSGGVHGLGNFLHAAKLMGARAAFEKPFELATLVGTVRDLAEEAANV